MAPLKRMPPLPSEVHSSLGPLPVSLSDTLSEKEGAVGIVDLRTRSIRIDSGCNGEARWQTLFHELTHVALYDGGATDALTREQEELVCNAVGSFLAAMMKAGKLKVSPK